MPAPPAASPPACRRDARRGAATIGSVLRIGFDLDGVLADMDAALLRRAEALFGEAVTRANRGAAGAPAPASSRDTASDLDASSPDPSAEPRDDSAPALSTSLTPRQERTLWGQVRTIENFWTTLEEIEPGAVARLAAAAAARGWEIIFLTKRPRTAGHTAQIQTQRWLVAKGFPLPSVYVVQGSRGLIAAALDLDIVVDDRPENCLDVVVDSKARAILVWRDGELPAAARRLGIGAVRSVAECLDILTQIDARPSEQPGVMARVMRLLGLKEPAGA
jgi:hypothetical protein